MDLLGDHLSYVLLVVFGLFAVGVHAYSLFGQQIPGNTANQTNALLDSLSVLSLGGQYSVFRGFVFYLVVSESLYIILASSTMILQLSLNAMGREDMAGALSSGIKLNPLIPILASSVIISASQIKPLSNIEHSIRRIGHRIAGIPRNVYEIQERIQSTPLSNLKKKTLGEALGIQQPEEQLSPLIHASKNAQQHAAAVMAYLKQEDINPLGIQQFEESLRNIWYMYELAQLGSIDDDALRAERDKALKAAGDYLAELDELQVSSKSREDADEATANIGSIHNADRLRHLWRAQISRCFELESEMISSLCNQVLQAQGHKMNKLEDQDLKTRLKVSRIMQLREQSNTELYDQQSFKLSLANMYLMRDTVASLDVNKCEKYQAQISGCMKDLSARAAQFDALVEEAVLSKAQTPVATEKQWVAFFEQCQSLEADLISILTLFFADQIEKLDALGMQAASKIASYAETKAAVFVEAGASLELSEFRLEGFKHSLEKVFCLYEWTLGTSGSSIWANQETHQIITLFESIKHKFDAFETDLNELLEELVEVKTGQKEMSLKSRWKEAIARCCSLEDDLTMLLALLLINKPDVQLANYQLLDRLRDHVLERERNHEMNAFGMSAIFGVFLSMFLLTAHFSTVSEFKGSLRIPDGGVPAPAYEPTSLGPVHKDYVVEDSESGLLQTVLTQYMEEGGVRKSERTKSQEVILDFIGSTAGSFLQACLEVLDYLIIFTVSAGAALTIRSMRKVERRWSYRGEKEPPPMYSYLFVGIVAYIVSASLILLYRFLRIVVMPMLDSEANLLSSAHLTLFRDSFGEYLLFPMTAFVIVWYVLEKMDSKASMGFLKTIWLAIKFALLCTVINLVGKVLSDSFKTGWDVVHFILVPTIGFFSFMLMFAYCMKRYQVMDVKTGDQSSDLGLSGFLGSRGFGAGAVANTVEKYRAARKQKLDARENKHESSFE